jgi:hypothetical protein
VTIAHNMKGTGSSYGFARLTELSGALEQSARANDHDASERHLTSVRDYLGRVQLSPP